MWPSNSVGISPRKDMMKLADQAQGCDGAFLDFGESFWEIILSMDWFKGKFTGLSPIFDGKIYMVSCRFSPTNQSIDFGKSFFYLFWILYFHVSPEFIETMKNHHSISPCISPDVDLWLNSQRPISYTISSGLCHSENPVPRFWTCPETIFFSGNHQESHIPLGPLGPTLAVEGGGLRWDSEGSQIDIQDSNVGRQISGAERALEHDDIPMSL